MRPRGEVSIAIETCLAQRGSATFAEVAQQTQIGYAVARATLHNMLKCGRVEVVEQRAHARGNRPMNVYALRADAPAPAGLALQSAMRLLCLPHQAGSAVQGESLTDIACQAYAIVDARAKRALESLDQDV